MPQVPLADRRIASQRILFGPRAAAFAKLALHGPVVAVGSARSLALLDGIDLADGPVERLAVVKSHNPQTVVDAVRARADELRPATILAIGSSSAVDLGKAVRHGRDALLVTIPTALGGAEMTRGFGITRDGLKAGGSLAAPSEIVIYDAALLATLAPRELGSIGVNAWAHTIEAAYARNDHPLGVAAAVQSGRALPGLLLRAAVERDAALHAEFFEAAFLAGYALNACGMGLHHATCHVIGGWSLVPHGIVNAIVLPHALRANREVAPEAVARVEGAFGIPNLSVRANAIARAYGLPQTLAELGVDAAIVEIAPPRIAAAPHLNNNPAPVPLALIERVVREAFGT